MRCHDAVSPDKRVKMVSTLIRVLGYADDTVILEDGTTEGQQKLGIRVNSISKGSKEDADMLLNADNTVVMHIRAQEDDVSPTTQEEGRGDCKFTCPYLNCDFKFRTKSGKVIHVDVYSNWIPLLTTVIRIHMRWKRLHVEI